MSLLKRPNLITFFFALSLLFCVVQIPVSANMGDPTRHGDLVGEPSPLLDSIHVLREHLIIDMRPCAKRGLCLVDATYMLRNDGRAKTLDLVFIAGLLPDSTTRFTLLLDNVPVPISFSDSLPVPLSWRLPQYTPALEGNDSLPYEFTLRNDALFNGMKQWPSGNDNPVSFPIATPVILFSIDLPEGEHTVRVTYGADATGYGHGERVYIWQLGYVLAPARRWGSFGRLDAEILLPENWEAAVWPQMKRNGDTLIGTWNELPADAIAISTRMHISEASYWMAQYVPLIITALLTLLISFRLGWKRGKALGKKRGRLTGAIPSALFCALLSFILLGGGLVAVDAWEASLLGVQQLPGYPAIIALPFIAVGAFFSPFGLIFLIPPAAAMVGAAIARARALQAEPEEPTAPVLR